MIGVTGSFWLKSKSRATLTKDVATLVFYTLRRFFRGDNSRGAKEWLIGWHFQLTSISYFSPLTSFLPSFPPVGSVFSIAMTSAVNLVLTEVTSNSDGSAANYALGLFLFLFSALLARDIRLYRGRGGSDAMTVSRGRGGLHSTPHLRFANLQDPDDARASEAVMDSFQRQAKWRDFTDVSSSSSAATTTTTTRANDRMVGLGSDEMNGNGSSRHNSSFGFSTAQKLFHSLTTPRHMMLVPTIYVGISSLAVIICFTVLTHDWSANYPTRVKTCIYAILATSLLFTMAYLSVTLWRVLKIVFRVAFDMALSHLRPRLNQSLGLGLHSLNGHSPSSSSSSSTRTDVCELLSQFANHPLICSVAQVRIMGLCAAISGMYFGQMFGALDVEDTTKR